MHSPSNRGFTLVELLVGVAIIVLIAAIAIPVLTRARAYSYEASALGSLRSINAAQSAYASSCGAGFYAPSLTSLATPPLTISVRHFGTNQAGTIYSAFTPVAVTQTGVSNGANPIQ